MTFPFRSFNSRFLSDDKDQPTKSSEDQIGVENVMKLHYEKRFLEVYQEDGTAEPFIERGKHAAWLLTYLKHPPRSYASLDSSRAWICYWAIHALNIMNVEIPQVIKTSMITFLKSCEHPDGGYGGGPGQYAHLAPTYGAVMCLISLQSDEAIESINIESLKKFIQRQKQPNGSFTMQDGGEADMRSSYCALAVYSVLQLPLEEVSDLCAEFIISCQTYEGGFGGEPMTEAHGGYAFCAVAALVILDKFRLADVDSLLRWLTNKQMIFEGGFQGRSNKLVDGCYSFWQGAIFPLVDSQLLRENKDHVMGLFEARMLEEYIMVGCQMKDGGFRDKPDMRPDVYHTCYVLSGLSIAQEYSILKGDGVLGGEVNELKAITPVYNITLESEEYIRNYYLKKKSNVH